jgi:hypothetical protein
MPEGNVEVVRRMYEMWKVAQARYFVDRDEALASIGASR